jgi:hypothetical protein
MAVGREILQSIHSGAFLSPDANGAILSKQGETAPASQDTRDNAPPQFPIVRIWR